MKLKYKFWNTENLTILLIASHRNEGKKLLLSVIVLDLQSLF